MTLMLVFSLAVLENIMFSCEIFWKKENLQIICLNYEVRITFKKFRVIMLESKRVNFIISYTSCWVLCYLPKSKISAHSDEASQIYRGSKIAQN